MKLAMGNNWTLKLKHKVEAYEAIAGIKQTPRREAAVPRMVGTFAGGSVRKTQPSRSGTTPTQVAAYVMNFAGNIFTVPFQMGTNADILKFSHAYIKELLGSKGASITNNRRVKNLMQAIIRNPILRGDYKMHKQGTKAKKGFERSLIDTGQFFRSIQVIIKRKS